MKTSNKELLIFALFVLNILFFALLPIISSLFELHGLYFIVIVNFIGVWVMQFPAEKQ